MERDLGEGISRITVCVTGASGFIGSWLVKTLLQRGYYVRATVRDPGNMKKVKHIVELPNASTHLSLWKGELIEEGSFDEAIQGCSGVFHVASPMDFASVEDPEKEMIKPTVNGILNIMKSCHKARTVKRLIYTSTAGAVAVQQPPLPLEFDENCWTDIDFCRTQKMSGWSYLVAKTSAEKAAWDYAKQSGLDLITVQPPFVIGPFITPFRTPSVEVSLALITGNEAIYPMLAQASAVHLVDLCNAHIYLLEHPEAKGRYICSSHCFTIVDLAASLTQKYPQYNIPTKFKGVDESLKAIPCSSKKLLDLGFKFKYSSNEYDVADLFAEALESCREMGFLPGHSASETKG